MKNFNNSKIIFAASLVSTNDQSAGGYHYQLDTTINILLVNDIVQKENGFERSDDLFFNPVLLGMPGLFENVCL